MCGCQNLAAEDSDSRIRCCRGFFSVIAEAHSYLLIWHCGLFTSHGARRRACRAVAVILEHVQASEQKSRGKVSPVDSAVDNGRTPLHALRLQRLGQFGVPPVTRPHRALYQPRRLKPPVLHGLRLRLSRVGFRVKRNGAANATHIESALSCRGSASELKSILSHFSSGNLYLWPKHPEVKPMLEQFPNQHLRNRHVLPHTATCPPVGKGGSA